MLERFEKGCRLEEDGTYRDAYADPAMILFVWRGDKGPSSRVVGFQVVWPERRMIAWNENEGLKYCQLSEDDSGRTGARSPVATKELGPIPLDDIREFESRAGGIDKGTADYIVKRMSPSNHWT